MAVCESRGAKRSFAQRALAYQREFLVGLDDVHQAFLIHDIDLSFGQHGGGVYRAAEIGSNRAGEPTYRIQK